jgi:hypothetical protein
MLALLVAASRRWRQGLIALAAASLVACAGGGGTGHVPPDRIEAGKTTALEVEYYVWGFGWGDLESRFTDLRCHYRTGDGSFRVLAMEISRVLEDKLVARCVLPPLSAADRSVENRFSYRLDGHHNERESEVVPIVAAP